MQIRAGLVGLPNVGKSTLFNTMTKSSVDPLADYEVIVTELMLKDLDSIEKRQAKVVQLTKAAAQKPKELKALETEAALLISLTKALQHGDLATARTLMTPEQE